MKEGTVGSSWPTWTLTEEEFLEKLGIPASANVMYVGVNVFEGTITVVGSSR